MKFKMLTAGVVVDHGATLESGEATFWSRSRQRLWKKGESSGHVLQLVSIQADCDNDTLLVLARPQGPTCHLQRASCFPQAPAAVWFNLGNAVLELLMSAPGRLFGREPILANVWGTSEDPLTNVVDVYIRRLRARIDREGAPALIHTVRGLGYRLEVPPASQG